MMAFGERCERGSQRYTDRRFRVASGNARPNGCLGTGPVENQRTIGLSSRSFNSLRSRKNAMTLWRKHGLISARSTSGTWTDRPSRLEPSKAVRISMLVCGCSLCTTSVARTPSNTGKGEWMRHRRVHSRSFVRGGAEPLHCTPAQGAAPLPALLLPLEERQHRVPRFNGASIEDGPAVGNEAADRRGREGHRADAPPPCCVFVLLRPRARVTYASVERKRWRRSRRCPGKRGSRR